MATYEQAMQALRNADAAGNIEDAKRLAAIANKLKPHSGGTMPFVNQAIAESVGAPIDLLTSGLNLVPGVDIEKPFMGSESIKSGMQSIGIKLPDEGQKPRTIPDHIGQVVGQASALMFPVGAGVSKLAQGTNLTGRVASSIWNSIIRHPYLAMTSELTGAVGAGVGRGVAEQEFPDSPALKTTTELVGGITGSVGPTALAHTPTAILIRSGKNILYKLALPFTKKGGTYRAGEHLKSLVPSPDIAAQNVAAETISDLPPAVASGEKKIISLYKGLVGQDPIADAKSIEKITNSIVDLESEMRKLGYGSPELLEEITRKRIAALELRMDKRVMDAATKAQAKLDALPVAQRKSAESRIIKKELEDVMHAQRRDDQKLWQKVNKNLPIKIKNTRSTYNSLVDDLGQAQKVDIPPSLKSNKIVKKKKLTETTLREMQSLRSKLLETSRIARKDGQWNRSRIAEDVADAILQDIEMASTPDVAHLKAAIAATKKFKVRFESGEVGKILGYSKSGAPAINPDLALEMTVGRMGERGAIDISKIAVTPEAQAATKRFLARSFTDYASDMKTGTINPVKAERWIKTNEAILDEFPDLNKQISGVADAQALADQTRIRMNARKAKLRDPKISVSAQYLNKADMGQEISSILKSKHPSRMASELVLQAKKDVSGNALDGLRAGFVEHILEKSTIGSFNELGQQTLSGRAILNFIKKNESVLRTVFDNPQITRMKKIGNELSKIETFEKIKPGKTELELKDWASNSLRMFGRLIGARVGGKVGADTMGGSLQYAQVFSSRGKRFMEWLTRDTAQQLIHDAILAKDPSLLKSLLLPISKPTISKKNLILLNKNLNAWLLSTGDRVIEE